MKKAVSCLVKLARSRAFKSAVVCAVIGMTMSLAHAEGEALPTGLPDISTYIGLGITVLAGVAATAVGGYVGFLALRKCLKWVRTAMG